MLRRRYYRTGRQRYSNETSTIGINITANILSGTTFPYTEDSNHLITDRGITVVPTAQIQGTRKVKNITVKITGQYLTGPVFCALVYVPDGTLPNALNLGNGSSFYEPNQNVITTFVLPQTVQFNTVEGGIDAVPSGQNTYTISTRLARNLASGDRIVLLMSPGKDLLFNAATPPYICGTCNYAIKY